MAPAKVSQKEKKVQYEKKTCRLLYEYRDYLLGYMFGVMDILLFRDLEKIRNHLGFK